MARISAQERRDKIIQTACAMFSERGFRGTKTKDLAKQAKISEALLFRHFPDKKMLYEAMLAYKMEEQFPPLLEGLSVDDRPERVLPLLALRITQQNLADPSLMRLLLFSALEGHELSDLFFQRKTLPILAFLKDFFKRGIDTQAVKSGDPELMARAFLALIFGYLQTRVLFRVPALLKRTLQKTLQTYVEIYLTGILP